MSQSISGMSVQRRQFPPLEAPIRVQIVASHVLIRAGLRELVGCSRDMLIVGESCLDPASCEVMAARAHDVAVLLLTGAAASDLTVLEQLASLRPDMRLVLVLQERSGYPLAELMRLGAHAIVGARSTPEELETAMRQAHRGQRYLSPAYTTALIDELAACTAPAGGSRAVLETLSAREREVVEHLVAGASTSLIAGALGIGPHTVDKHRRNAMRKLAVQSLADLVKLALRLGLTRLD